MRGEHRWTDVVKYASRASVKAARLYGKGKTHSSSARSGEFCFLSKPPTHTFHLRPTFDPISFQSALSVSHNNQKCAISFQLFHIHGLLKTKRRHFRIGTFDSVFNFLSGAFWIIYVSTFDAYVNNEDFGSVFLCFSTFYFFR